MAFVNENTILGSRGFEVLTYSIEQDRFESIVAAGDFRKKLMSKSRLLSRGLRLGFRHGIEAATGTFFLRLGSRILRLNLETAELTEEAIDDQYHAPLAFNEISGIQGFDDQTVFGEYFHNPRNEPVGIYSWNETSDRWSKVYEFPAGTINHVHSIVPDPIRNGVWILTGDFDQAAAIWFARDNFQSVECIAKGSQDVRACFAMPNKDGLFYCTDSPLEENFLAILKFQNETNQWVVEKKQRLPGPVIFHGQCKSGVLFSTSVEPMPNSKTIFWSVLSRKRGPGVLANYSSVWHLGHDGELTEITRNEKDFWPYLFQFGMSTFPSNGTKSCYIVLFNIALKNNDYGTEIWHAPSPEEA